MKSLRYLVFSPLTGLYKSYFQRIIVAAQILEEFTHMRKLPLFPLNTVLFPGMLLTLHIFEDRYKLLVGHCLAEKRPFGVLLLQEGTPEYHIGQKVTTYRIGCTAEITQVQPVSLGRMNILAFGKDRFNVMAFDHSEPYLVGEVDFLQLEPPEDSAHLAQSIRLLASRITRYLDLSQKAENKSAVVSDLPEDPIELAYFGASLLKIDSKEKQLLLEEDHADKLVNTVSNQYRKEVTLLSLMLQDHTPESNSTFSLN